MKRPDGRRRTRLDPQHGLPPLTPWALSALLLPSLLDSQRQPCSQPAGSSRLTPHLAALSLWKRSRVHTNQHSEKTCLFNEASPVSGQLSLPDAFFLMIPANGKDMRRGPPPRKPRGIALASISDSAFKNNSSLNLKHFSPLTKVL